MSTGGGFDRDKIIELLTELGRRLAAKGVVGRFYIVGGAAMALEFDTRRTTRDIDAVFDPPTTVADEAAAMARALGLPGGWLSAAAQAFIPGPDENPVSLDIEGLQVAISSPQNLLAMKMAAGRPQDVSDLVILFRRLKIKSPEQAVDIAVKMYGEGSAVLSEPRDSLLLLAESVLTRVRAGEQPD
jgi:predicted nucleotidyltransferase